MSECIFCDWPVELKRLPNEIMECNCPNCGYYRMERDAFDDLPGVFKKSYSNVMHLASGYIRETNELGLTLETITMENHKNLFKNAFTPARTMQKLYKALLYVYRKTEYLNQSLISNTLALTPAIAYTKNNEELNSIFVSLSNLNYLELTNTSIALTLQGMEKAEILLSDSSLSEQCFVAMWFDESMKKIYDEHLSRAVLDAGFKPLMIASEEYNDDICDQIMAEIRKSRFVIADFTGHRGGVYFEAGFAYGLGLPVVWTCHKDWFNSPDGKTVATTITGELTEIIENRKIHFDIEHFNFILWEDGEELYDKIKKRILATICLVS